MSGVSEIHKLRIKSDRFIANYNKTVERIVNFDPYLEGLNKNQLKKSMLADGSPMKRLLSPGYAAWKSMHFPESSNGQKSNWLLTGNLFNNMDIKVKGNNYFINSLVPYAAKLFQEFGNGFGIAPVNQPKAQKYTIDLLRKEYIRSVL